MVRERQRASVPAGGRCGRPRLPASGDPRVQPTGLRAATGAGRFI